MFTISQKNINAAAQNGCATLSVTRVTTKIQRPFYTGAVVEALYYSSGDYGVSIENPVRFSTAQAAEAFHGELLALVLRHAEGKIE